MVNFQGFLGHSNFSPNLLARLLENLFRIWKLELPFTLQKKVDPAEDRMKAEKAPLSLPQETPGHTTLFVSCTENQV